MAIRILNISEKPEALTYMLIFELIYINRISKGDMVFIFLYAFTPLLYKWKKPASVHPVLQATHGIEAYLFAADILSLSLPTAMKF